MLDPAEYPVILREAAEIADHACDPELGEALREIATYLEVLAVACRGLLAEHARRSLDGGWTPQGGHVASQLRELLTAMPARPASP